MANCGSLLKSTLVASILFLVSGQTRVSQAAGVQESPSERQETSWTGEKLASCCRRVSTKQITEPIVRYLVQKPNFPCVRAVIFQTESGLYCNQINPWALRKIQEFRKTKAQASAPPSSVSLLSIITTTTSSPSSSPSPSSTLLPSSSPSSSTPPVPADETFSESDYE
uniref:Chemokine interleukin-8-like domain-containing protein n=2 Tax=Nothobranchius korthausae TaxID=1143690 RepID=A0A1A8FCW5_9TELE